MVSRALLTYIASRTATYIATILMAFTITFILLRAMPVSAVETIIASMTAQGQVYDPKALMQLRRSLYELFGLTGSPIEQYFRFLYRFLTLDFGPSILAFPTPVKELILDKLPWTVGLLGFSVIISWTVGNMLGTLAAVFEGTRFSKVLQSVALVIYPIPYYIMALVLIYLFAYLIPIFPLTSGAGIISQAITLEAVVDLVRRSALPALSIIIVGMLGWWFLSSRTLTLNVLSEDFTVYAELRGLPRNYILRKYVLRNILLPQTTALGLALGTIFSGALLTEIIFAYPGLGLLMYRAIANGDYSTALGVLSFSMIGVATATYILDLIYPFIDPRVRYR